MSARLDSPVVRQEVSPGCGHRLINTAMRDNAYFNSYTQGSTQGMDRLTVIPFNAMPDLLVVVIVFVGVPASLVMLFMWLRLGPAEDAFINDVESEIGEVPMPRDVIKDGKDL